MKILFFVENVGVMLCFLYFDNLKLELKDIFIKGCECKKFYNVDDVLFFLGLGCYVVNFKYINLKVFFLEFIFENFEYYKSDVF